MADSSSYSNTFSSNTTGDSSDDDNRRSKKPKTEVILPLGFLDPLPPEERALFNRNQKPSSTVPVDKSTFSVNGGVPTFTESVTTGGLRRCKQFWKAGDDEAFTGDGGAVATTAISGVDHLRVHPKFLHSNATSHKWALGAIAELLDNALDEVIHGATFAHIDVIENRKDRSKILLVEDNGGGMSPEIMRNCMSLGYSAKSNMSNTIGQYGNGFKTSTMRLGADVIVFTRCRGENGGVATQSVGMLSYTFLRRTMKEDIVVPIIDYQKSGHKWNMLARSSPDDWKRNLDTLLMWSPYVNEDDLFKEFNLLKDHGTRVVIYNLWEDDEGGMELDFDTDKYDIQIRGANRDEKKIEMARNYPNSRHFLTYSHSLRSYAAILYLRIPSGFRIILRGKDVNHHNIVNDMMMKQELTYRPQAFLDSSANVTVGFVKDAKFHIDVQGFNVYHKNRLIKPFWRVWTAAGSDGRGVIGVLEADFIEPAHDKQGFERTIALTRLESRLREIQKKYWGEKCSEIGYAKGKAYVKRRRGQPSDQSARDFSASSSPEKLNSCDNDDSTDDNQPMQKKVKDVNKMYEVPDAGKDRRKVSEPSPTTSFQKQPPTSQVTSTKSHQKQPPVSQVASSSRQTDCIETNAEEIAKLKKENPKKEDIESLKRENLELRERLKKIDGLNVANLISELQYERDQKKIIEGQYMNAQQKIEELDKEQETLIDIFAEERSRREKEEESLRMRLNDASKTIAELVNKVKLLESRPTVTCKVER